MPIERGFLKEATPHVKVRIWGTDQLAAREFDGVIDTGFNGFISMPAESALAVGLAANIATTVTHADGKGGDTPSGIGWASFNGETRSEVVLVYKESTEVLLGMRFLEVFDLGLVILRGRVWLIPMAELTGTQIDLP